MDRLAAEFDQASRAAVEDTRKFNYNPTVWVSMMNDLGAVSAARRLLLSPDIQSGFERLARQTRRTSGSDNRVCGPEPEVGSPIRASRARGCLVAVAAGDSIVTLC